MAAKSPSVVENYFAEGQKKRRRRHLAVVAIMALLFFGLIGYGAKRLFIDGNTFRIARINVVGTKMVGQQEVLLLVRNVIFTRHKFLSAMLGTDTMLLWPSVISLDELKPLPAVTEVLVDKNYGAKEVTVTVKERDPYGIWCEPSPAKTEADFIQTNADLAQMGSSTQPMPANSTASTGASIITSSSTSLRARDLPHLSASSLRDSAYDCWWFDAKGVLFQKGATAEGNLIRRVDDYTSRSILPGSTVLDDRFMPSLISIFHALEISGVSVREVRLNDIGLQEVEVATYDGPKLFFSLRFPADRSASIITSLKTENKFAKLEYMDFRVEGRVFYK